ncbi:hypothetical protein TNCV_4192271 [Trichonephila clavipes]|nr:hypothetical protein TNCV_4192271 [Trichonephila clavipes]
MKTYHVERLMHVITVVAQNPPIVRRGGCQLGTVLRLKKCLAVGFQLITSNCQSLKESHIIGLKEASRANQRIARPMGRSDAAIRSDGKNGWTVADFGVLMVATDLRPHHIGRTD